MTKPINKDDRVLVRNSELNPLTNFHVIQELENSYRCRFTYGFVMGESNVPKQNISRHPIQVSEFTFRMWMNGQELPELNDYTKDLSNLKDFVLAYRIPLFCVKEILLKIKDRGFIEKLREGLYDSFMGDESTTNEIGVWVIDLIKHLPHDYKCQCVIEYSGEEIPAALFNSDRINDYFAISIFLLFFVVAVLKLELIEEETIIEMIDERLSQF